MSTPAWKPLPSARRITTRVSGSRPAVAQRVGELEPAGDRQCVHGRVVDRDDDDVLARFRADHARSILPGVSGAGGVSLWNATLPPGTRVARAPLAGDVVADVAIAGGGYTGLWTAYALKQADPSAADRGVRARDDRVRRVGSQRRLVFRVVRREPRRDRAPARARRGRRDATRDVRRRSTRSSAWSRPRRSNATGRAAERSRSRRFPRTSLGCGRRSTTIGRGVSARTTTASSRRATRAS